MSEMGVFAVDRGLFDDPDFDPEPFTQREAWLWLIKEAAWKKRKRRISGNIIELERSQLTASIRFMAEAWQWSKSRVARFLERIAASGLIRKISGSGCQQLVITICNYSRFQRVSLPDRDRGTVAGHQRGNASDCNNIEITGDQNTDTESVGQQRDKQEDIKNTKSPHSPPKEVAASLSDDEEIIDLEFEKFWRAFPPGRKQDKLKSRRKYRRIISGQEAELKATTAELLAGAMLYASKMAGREARFTKMPCTWLTNGCWLEDNAGAPPVFNQSKEQNSSNANDWADKLARRVLAGQAGGSR